MILPRRLHQLSKTPLHLLPPLQRLPYLMRRLAHHLPTHQIIRKRREILLLALPLRIATALDPAAHNRQRRISALDTPRRHYLVLGQAIGDEVLLQLRFDELPALIRIPPVHAVRAGAPLEKCAGEPHRAERGDGAPGPEKEAAGGAGQAVQEVLVHRVDEQQTRDLLQVAGTEDAGDDAAGARGDEDPGALFAGAGERF